MKYRLLKDLPHYVAGTIFRQPTPSVIWYPEGSSHTHTYVTEMLKDPSFDWFEYIDETPYQINIIGFPSSTEGETLFCKEFESKEAMEAWLKDKV